MSGYNSRGEHQTREELIVNVVVSSRHMEVTPAMKQFAEEKSQKLLKYYDRIQEIEVVFDNANAQMSCEILVNVEHKKEFVATHIGTDRRDRSGPISAKHVGKRRFDPRYLHKSAFTFKRIPRAYAGSFNPNQNLVRIDLRDRYVLYF